MSYGTKQLRFNPRQQHWQYMSINPNMPPYRPNITPPTPQVGPYMAYAAGTLAVKIQQQAADNPLRMTVFNMAAENNFGNAYFDVMATMAIELTAYLMARENVPPEQAVEKATELVTDYYTAANVREFQVLNEFINDPNMRAGIQQTIQNFDNTANILGQFMNQMRNGGGHGYQQQQQAGHFHGQTQQQQYAPVTSYSDGISAGGGGGNFSGSNSIFEPVVSKTGMAPAQNNGGYSQQYAPVDANQAVMVAATAAPTEEPAVKRLPANTSNWVPDLVTEPYFYAYSPSQWNASLLVMANGSTIPDYTLKTKEEQMDFNRHATPNVFGKVPEFLDITQSAKTMERIQAGVKQLNHEVLDDEPEGNVTTIKTLVAPAWLFATSEADAWMRASLVRLQVEPGEAGLPDVYRTYVRVAEAIVGSTDETQLIQTLVKSKSFLGLREKLTNLGGEMSTMLYNTINFRMTELVNRKLQKELGLRKMTIGNFHDDIGELIEYLKSKYGEVLKSAFIRSQESDIAKTLQTLGADVVALESDAILRGMKFPADHPPVITFVASNYSLTYLDCMSWDLNIEMGDDIPVKLTHEVTPLFYQLVVGAFQDADKHETEEVKALAIARVLMRTQDGRIFECTRGSLADESYLVTLIK
jgi:hypothetical protein